MEGRIVEVHLPIAAQIWYVILYLLIPNVWYTLSLKGTTPTRMLSGPMVNDSTTLFTNWVKSWKHIGVTLVEQSSRNITSAVLFPPEIHNKIIDRKENFVPSFTTCVTIETVISDITNRNDPINLMKYCRVIPWTFWILTNLTNEPSTWGSWPNPP